MISSTKDGLASSPAGQKGFSGKARRLRLLRNISVGRKLAIMATTMIIPIIGLMVVYGYTLHKTIAVAVT